VEYRRVAREKCRRVTREEYRRVAREKCRRVHKKGIGGSPERSVEGFPERGVGGSPERGVGGLAESYTTAQRVSWVLSGGEAEFFICSQNSLLTKNEFTAFSLLTLEVVTRHINKLYTYTTSLLYIKVLFFFIDVIYTL
jgi:hypothetical protein